MRTIKQVILKMIKYTNIIQPKPDLLVLDDCFPFKLSAFRYTEYIWLLKTFTKMNVVTSGKSISYFKKSISTQEVIDEFY